ncbi:uncharacterized protein BDZ83DRAFT_611687 [Colletotrichum acutatum]|uniref:Uncharacterized protein n=1 Tax=Glomerella acutata TaxID=27357 RepID=A0AAD8XHQ1_GLOAC|nr:uncharacterized protein BDZ83DRAFT_611687 [Colletotrichum acutatum]KAK1727677.1 hypothetical protein BDZ83DRAFT_611687 [Colletotrichum acutatum]
MYRIVHILYCTVVPEHCLVVSLKTSTSKTIYLGLEDTSRNARFVRNCERTAKEEEKCPLFLAPGRSLPRYIPIPFWSCSPNLLLACSPSRPALPYPNFLALDIHPILSYPLSSQPILTLVSPARSLDQSFDQRRAPSRFPVVPAFPNRPDVCPSFNLPQVAFVSISGVYPFDRPPLPLPPPSPRHRIRHESGPYYGPSPDA